MTLQKAVDICRETGLSGCELVEFAQQLVNQNMKYSLTNSFDTPEKAFEKGLGYCWHRSSALNKILIQLGFDSHLVYASRNCFPEAELMGTVVKDLISGHVWCRVAIDGVEKDVCPGSPNNKPGTVHFIPMSKVLRWNKGIECLSYFGSALVNYRRKKKYGK